MDLQACGCHSHRTGLASPQCRRNHRPCRRDPCLYCGLDRAPSARDQPPHLGASDGHLAPAPFPCVYYGVDACARRFARCRCLAALKDRHA